MPVRSDAIEASGFIPQLTRAEKVFTLLGALLGLLLAALDQTIVATAGPAIQADLHVAPSLYAWITTAYLVTSTVMVPIYGKLSDLLGRKRILVTGIVIFLLGSFLCAICARFAAQRAHAPGPDVRAQLASDEASALDAVDRAHDAFKWGFTDAIATVYRLAIGIAVLALVIVSFLPELPLRRTLGPPSMAE